MATMLANFRSRRGRKLLYRKVLRTISWPLSVKAADEEYSVSRVEIWEADFSDAGADMKKCDKELQLEVFRRAKVSPRLSINGIAIDGGSQLFSSYLRADDYSIKWRVSESGDGVIVEVPAHVEFPIASRLIVPYLEPRKVNVETGELNVSLSCRMKTVTIAAVKSLPNVKFEAAFPVDTEPVLREVLGQFFENYEVEVFKNALGLFEVKMPGVSGDVVCGGQTDRIRVEKGAHYKVVSRFLKNDLPNQWARMLKAAESGDEDAQLEIANYYLLQSEEDKFYYWSLVAASQGQVEAIANVGKAYARGIHVDADLHEAIPWLQRGVEKGISSAAHELGRSLSQRR